MEADIRPKCVDVFSGCGGFTLGLAAAGFNVVGHVEVSKDCLETYEANKDRGGFGNSELIGRDITKISDDEILRFREKHGRIDAVVGGPPCQSFSMAGQRIIGDPRDNLFLHFVRFVRILEPGSFIVENVPGLLTKKHPDGKLMIDVIKQAFKAIGYATEDSMLDAANYGVPQTRRRVIIIGTKPKTGKEILFPLPTHFGPGEGTKDPPKSCMNHQYRQCECCGKYYASYTYTQNRGYLCLFCDWHNKSKDKAYGLTEFSKGWVITKSKVQVPAKPKDMYLIRHIEKRASLDGATSFLYCESIDDGFKNCLWLKGSEARTINDDPVECTNAEAFVFCKMIAKPLTEAANGDD